MIKLPATMFWVKPSQKPADIYVCAAHSSLIQTTKPEENVSSESSVLLSKIKAKK